jgi:ATP-dependent DNA helicase RecG
MQNCFMADRSAPQRALDKLGLSRDIDLALHLPLRYIDETRLIPFARLLDGEPALIEGEVVEVLTEGPRRALRVRLRDLSPGSAVAGRSPPLSLRFLHPQPSHRATLVVGARVRAQGEVRHSLLGAEMVHPSFRIVEPGTPLQSTLTPVYPTVAQLPQTYLRRAIESALQRVDLRELLPAEILPQGTDASWPSLRDAIRLLHRPPPALGSAVQQRDHPAWTRLKYEELLAQQLSQRLAHAERDRLRAPVLRVDADAPGALRPQLLAALPFGLTGAQQRVSVEIAADLARSRPMHRLLQGDVGAGKTVVAALAAAVALDAGWQCVLMAPTEILAEQHVRKMVQWLEPLRLGADQRPIGVAWLTGSRKGRQRRTELERVASGAAQLIVGTHALIQDEVSFHRLGLAIVDEQHRFGVQQRLALRRKLAVGDLEPHLLMMTATPIPRTLAMTAYGDLDISTLDELPPGRTPIVTRKLDESRRQELIERVRAAVLQGRQVYWVCPLIEADEDSEAPRTGPELANVTATFEELSSALPPDQVGLLHGRLKSAEKAEVMARFSAGELGVLVATTVIEVGVDVPNASVMVIEQAERFGLAQLHQLRGRVGRGAVASACVLLHGAKLSETGRARLRAMVETQDGFEIARRDLALRGPGEVLGERQSGSAMLRFADLLEDQDLLEQAGEQSLRLLKLRPDLAQAHVERWLGGRTELIKA